MKAKNDAVQIASAIDAFVAEYGYFPIPGHADVTLSESNRVAAGELMDVLSPSTNIPGKLNPRLISFLSIPKAVDGHNGRLNGHTGPYLDPWGKAYFIVVDGDGDGYVEGPSGHDPRAKIHQAVIVWSRGDPATAAFAEPAKWIKSWE